MDDLISRKEAIDAIRDADVCVQWNGIISDEDAVDITVKATKRSLIYSVKKLPSAQPETHEERTETHSCDLIDRQAAIDAVRRSETLDRAFGYGHAVDALRELPSAQQRWIPCSERLPLAEYGESDNVLVTCGHRDSDDTSVRWINTLYFNGGCWCYPTGETYDQKVYAWMPLPEPYREEGD